MKKMIRIALAAAALLASVSTAHATIVLNFEGVGDFNQVDNFYNGGAGTNYGISFTNALGLVDGDAGGSGNFGGEPSPNTAIFFTDNTFSTMNVAAGFDTGFSFFYTSPFFTGSVIVYDGLSGTGNVLASLSLPLTPDNGQPDPTGSYSPFLPFGVNFSGTAHSVDFGGVANQIAFDDITLGSATAGGAPVPEPSTMLLLGGGLAGLAFWRRKQQSK